MDNCTDVGREYCRYLMNPSRWYDQGQTQLFMDTNNFCFLFQVLSKIQRMISYRTCLELWDLFDLLQGVINLPCERLISYTTCLELWDWFDLLQGSNKLTLLGNIVSGQTSRRSLNRGVLQFLIYQWPDKQKVP